MSDGVRTWEASVLAEGFSFLEGPRWRDGRLYVSDFFNNRVLSFGEDGSWKPVCEVTGMPSGLGWTTDGSMLISSMVDRRLLRLDGDVLSEVADLSGLAAWHCNDMVVDDDGRAYVGNFGWDDESDPAVHSTVLVRVDPDGSTHVAADDLVFPNGTVISDDGRTLLVAETFVARISAFDRATDGTLGNRRTWAAFSEPFTSTVDACASGVPLPDGMALDAEGALWIGDAAGSGALRVAPGGKILEKVPTGDHAVFAVALGGADRRTLFMCSARPYGKGDPRAEHVARLLSCRVDVPGVGLP